MGDASDTVLLYEGGELILAATSLVAGR
jgi:hypothetical protein